MGQAVWCLSKPSYAWASAPPQPSTKVEERRLAWQAGRLELNGCTCCRGRGRRGLFGCGPKQPLGCAGKALGSPAVDSDGGHADTCGRRLARTEGCNVSGRRPSSLARALAHRGTTDGCGRTQLLAVTGAAILVYSTCMSGTSNGLRSPAWLPNFAVGLKPWFGAKPLRPALRPVTRDGQPVSENRLQAIQNGKNKACIGLVPSTEKRTN